jgi:hypothetical protein
MKLAREVLVQHFGDLWPTHNRGFTELLIACRQLFDGDLDQVLIMSAIGERRLTPERSRGLTYAEFMKGRRGEAPPGRVNAQCIADSTGIPRETVRRKIARLIDRGWIEKHDNCTFSVTAKAAVDLAPATQATFDYLLAIGNVLLDMSTEARE